MSGATGAGSAGTPTGTESDGGGRGSAAHATDPHTTQLRAIDAGAADSPSPDTHGSQGGTVTDTRGPQTQQSQAGTGPAAQGARPQQAPAAQPAPPQSASPLPGERQPQQPAGPYHPPQAYQNQAAAQGAPAPTGAVRRPRTGARTTPRIRKARLRVAKADPWSVMKVSFLLSIALGICTIVASAVLWMVMDAMGVFSTVGGTISEATGSNESNGFDLQSFLSLPHVLMFASIIAVIDVVLATALATLGAFIYNLSAGFVGGIELTLAEDE
ncbi:MULTISPECIES: DUF3566 domain-containing protein [unclassified Streptomyces]|uniref:DUF3566 domain-containing protein n=1 Tax=unclassified Streptomyces TaxID=2593676 RepID=UPI002258B30B|nr:MULTISPECIES: DUF3566 domain-containing protein [unclassified Streptomyces]MCX5049532.1 DUF3566 domain-containing protein [Streptomyces sp. NBC_00474]MCX5055723.1 DUF3566 domain-containing protein [Streptomyces sp. NBC_00452]MCX5247418.1 DUF3566 domain-containing protein [Streptomyces sp. NBC_00201]MCX5286800.1 DUF3566 domain-containing protein [Streptomyces sp. NBC_00183]